MMSKKQKTNQKLRRTVKRQNRQLRRLKRNNRTRSKPTRRPVSRATGVPLVKRRKYRPNNKQISRVYSRSEIIGPIASEATDMQVGNIYINPDSAQPFLGFHTRPEVGKSTNLFRLRLFIGPHYQPLHLVCLPCSLIEILVMTMMSAHGRSS
jgi:hypothetical protein